MKYPAAIQRLIEYLSHFPTVGPKTAERYVFYLLKQPEESLRQLARALVELKAKTTLCRTCLAIAETNPCSICADSRRLNNLLCLVADTRDLASIESTRQYPGLYFVLSGELDPVKGVKPENLNIKLLLKRLQGGKVKEIILAFNPTMEGETTAMYLSRVIKQSFPDIKITRLAKGLPMGADLEYADEITLANALKYRQKI